MVCIWKENFKFVRPDIPVSIWRELLAGNSYLLVGWTLQ